MKIKLSLLIVTLVGLFFFSPSSVSASSNFATDYHVTYTIDESGIAHALVNGTLTNTSSQYYASSYKMQLGFDTITNVQAQDSGGAITPQVSKNNDGYVIALNFNKKAVGLNARQQFSIMFDTPTLARHYGRIWEIDIPGISNPDDFSTFVVELKTPSSFGLQTYSKPKQPSKDLIFNKETLGKSGISLAFGDKQMYTFHLAYHLRNGNLFPIDAQVALPPSTNYQDVSITNIAPAPTNVIEDKDGNWLAQYHLASAQRMDVTASGNVVIHLTPKEDPKTSTELNEYLKEQKYWEVSNGKIRALADKLKTPEAIYQYVIHKLHYDFARVTRDKARLGALSVLQNQNSAVCREFTDLFIALSRAAGIPAREMDGFAYTENAKQRPLSQQKDILHVWPEYYDSEKKTWIMVDPTWGSTTGGVDYFDTLDFDHFAFVIKGESSIYPIPAGDYKFTNDPVSKDVQVGFTTAVPDEAPGFSLDSTFPKVTIGGLPIKGNILIKNTGSVYVPKQLMYLSTKTFTPGEQTIATSGIPPFGYLSVPVGFKPTNALTNTEGDYTIRVDGKSSIKHVQAKLFFLTPLGGGILFGILAIIILIITFKSRGLRLFK